MPIKEYFVVKLVQIMMEIITLGYYICLKKDMFYLKSWSHYGKGLAMDSLLLV